MPARGPNRRGAIGGELDVFTSFPRAIQFAQQARLPLVHVHGPHLLVWARDITCGVRNFSCRVEFTAARINNRAAIRCEPQARERHARQIDRGPLLLVHDFGCGLDRPHVHEVERTDGNREHRAAGEKTFGI